MSMTSFNFAPLLAAGLPAPAARWTGLAKYSFVGGNNDPDGLPVGELVEAMTAVLKREGKSLATYNLAHGPQGYLPLREFLTAKLKRDAGIACTVDDLLIVSGSLQALDLVNHTLLARGDKPKYIYTIPTVQNPTGTIMPESRRAEMLRLSAEYGVPIFEDDCYADLIWSGQRPPAIHAMSPKGGVIHIGSFSKSIAPALRVGFIVAPWDVMSR